MNFSGDLLVRTVDKRTGKNGKDYLDLTLCDCTGDINAKMWNPEALPGIPVASGAVHVDSQIEEFNGRIQMRVNRMLPASNPDWRKLIPCAPETPDVMRNKIEETIDTFATEKLRLLVREALRLAGPALDWYPAAQRMHHAERAGLLHHTTSMLTVAEQICAAYPFLCRELLLAGVIIHDLAKIKELDSDKLGNVPDYTRDGLLVGHLVRGVSDIDKAAENIGMAADDELLALLEHMLISHHGIPEYGSPRMPMFPEAEALHWIDTLDARMNEMEGIQRRTPAGAFSERILSLDGRRMYHPVFTKETAGQAEPADAAQTKKASQPVPVGTKTAAPVSGRASEEGEQMALLPY